MVRNAWRSGISRRGVLVGGPAVVAAVPAAAETAAAAVPTAGGVDNPFRDFSLQSLTATRERPLFSATRRPPPVSGAPAPVPSAPSQAQAPAPAPTEPQGPPLSLIGTITGGERPVVLLFNKLTRAVSMAHEGDDALGWRVTAVSARSAVVEKDGVSVTLGLPKPGDAVDATPGADAAQQPQRND